MTAVSGYTQASAPARRMAIALIAVFALSALALAWMLRGNAALDASSPPVLAALVPAVVAYLVTGIYCGYLGIGAIRARQFPAPQAHLPVATKIRGGAAGLLMGAIAVMAALGHGVLAWLLVSL